MLKTILTFLILFSTKILFAQQILISTNYTENGSPIGLIKSKNVELNKTISIILNNGRDKLSDRLLFLYIEKEGSEPGSQFTKLLRPDKNKNWFAYNYTFTAVGSYEIYFTDFTKQKIASTKVSVFEREQTVQRKTSLGELKPKLEIIFTTKIENDLPANIKKSVSINKEGGQIYVFIADDKPLGTNKIMMNVWKKKTGSDVHDQYVDSKKYEIDSSWYDTHFRYRFTSPGDYKINIFDEKEILLKSAYIIVEN